MASTNHLDVVERELDRLRSSGVPTPHSGLIERPELISRLRAAKDFRLVLITAPAGYAKTSVLAQWADQDPRPFAWLSLTSRDDRPSRLLNRIVEALDSVSVKGKPFVVVVDDADSLRTKGALTA